MTPSVVWKTVLCGLVALAPTVAAVAQGQAKTAPSIETTQVALELPTTVEGCLKTMDVVLAEAEAMDLLDEQIDEAEAELAKMERYCVEKRYIQAVEAAKAVQRIVAANK